jgi:hypothetical protein
MNADRKRYLELLAADMAALNLFPAAAMTEVKTMQSTDDERVANNVMRHEYRVLTVDEKLQMQEVKDIGLRFVQMCDAIGSSRELSLAKTKMEEAVMWAVKHLTK